MPGVVYIKLTSGEEIIGGLELDDGQTVVVNRPLAMESGIDEDDPTRRYVFMSRFSPYADSPSITIKHAAVAFVQEASPMVSRYYEVSLRYCERFSDPKWAEGITETTEQIETALRADAPARAKVDRDKEDALSRFGLVSGFSSNTVN